MRRALAVLAAVPLILSAAACGSDDGAGAGAGTDTGAVASGGSSGVKVAGDVGAKPTVTFPSGSPATKSSYEVIQPGTGDGVKAGDRVIVNLTVYNWDGGGNAAQGSSYDTKTPETIAVNEQLPQVLQEGFTKIKHGGRLLAVLANDAVPQQQATTPAEPTKVFVFDVVGTQPPALKAATGKETGESLKGVKVDNPGGEKAPTLTTKTGDKPGKELVVKTVIQGTGEKVREGQTLTVHYTGKIWGTDKQFDSSWERGEPAEFPLGQVIQGWQKGLAGVPVGSRVVMSIPPDLGYGSQEQQGIPANSTLVFVVDVLGAF
ncbi:FKBP-type peptidyl-prolyl cis-trans isomerase [Nonomuraea sp. MG754425]|uniref:FKBP-type peptidyl-prolyl cis-trans isomerase n=1 Tax=Nonomuraea sp. MG754425 TaxID=2570319 RepID=UPI001F02570F|nr:FKBP-type peptidyl-prolyl cis-trans isomerase [Nonomuraea sp. MG754425]MCF6476016.1 FKBP-type peptidyl-prolyl cis-trans isomerase [Nonomuraea sp. MG754425]